MAARGVAWLPVLIALLATGATAAGGRQLLEAAPALAPTSEPASGGQGAAPGPGPAEPTADILFTLTAAGARLSADELELLQVAPVTTFFTTQSKAGAYMTSEFANSSAGGKFVMASGAWLDSPVAVLKATDDDGKPASVLLSLAEPRYDNASRTLTFKTKILPATRASLPLLGGAAHRMEDDAENGAAAGVLSAPPDGELSDAALFIDQNAQQLGGAGELKWVIIRGGWGWRRWGWWGK